MFDFLKAKPEPVTHIVPAVPGGQQIPLEHTLRSALKRRPTSHVNAAQPAKRGMWVRYQGRTGILTNLEAGDVATVMLVDDEYGLNGIEVHVPSAELRQAWLNEIPARRRPEPEIAARMGYHLEQPA